MKFYGEEIGSVPTLNQVEIYIAEQGCYVTPEQVFEYWDAKEWRTKTGDPVKTLEAAVHVVNSIIAQRIRRESLKKEGKHRKKPKKTKKFGAKIKYHV